MRSRMRAPARTLSFRWSDIAAVVLAALTMVVLIFALRPQTTPPNMASSATPTIQPSNPSKTKTPSVLFIGDSYTAGRGLPEMSPGCRAAAEMGWLCQLSAVPGTGYISGGPANRFTVNPYIGESTSFAERIPKLAAVYQPDIVVLDGGRNDLFPPREDVFKAMSATIADARRAWPAAQLVFIRPRFLANPEDDLGFDDAFIARLLAEPEATGVVVLDPMNWFNGKDTSSMLAEDGIHPNQRGQAELGSAFLDSLLAHGFAGRTE